MEKHQEINVCTSNFQKNSIFLNEIAGPLQAGDSKGFYFMLKIMKTHGVDATKHLADRIIVSIDRSKSFHSGLSNILHTDNQSMLLKFVMYVCFKFYPSRFQELFPSN